MRYLQLVQDRIDVFRDMISALADDAQADAKGSAGDKHETALSMMHLEQEKLSVKLREALGQKDSLRRVNPLQKASSVVGMGSLVKSGDLHFFVCTALPKITESAATVFALSPHSPLGSALLGKVVGDEVSVQSKRYRVDKVM